MPQQKNEHPNLTETEIRAIRDLLKNEDRINWFWSSLRSWGAWLAGIVAFILLVWEFFERQIK